jgi:DNA polymerase I-like protein with 3'-5' exonuclease and polymerase domains
VPLLEKIGQYRQFEKVRRDFIESVVLEGSYKGRVHPQWYQTRGSSYMSGDDVGGTRSGRIACSNPNLSQIPVRNPRIGNLVRSLFIPFEGDKWFKGDLSQQEPRIALHYAYVLKLAGAAKARDIYLNDPTSDFHTIVMNMVNAVRNEPIDRDQSKTIGLGKMYGMGGGKMAKSLAMPLLKAKNLMSDYDRGFPWVKELLNYCAEVADKRGYVKTILGRRRRFNMWEPPYFQRGKFPIVGKKAAIQAYGAVRRAHLHKAMNSVVQGSAAEQMKKALVLLHSEGIKLLVTLYDEIGASISSEREAKLIKEITENAIPFEVPHLMKYKLLDSWGG